MNRILWLALLILAALPLERAAASGWRKDSGALAKVNKRIQGRVIDYTANHGVDNRMWSRSLGQRRDLYVYLPPNYDPGQPYPIAIWLHMGREDESDFLDGVVQDFDRAIQCGELPPLIVVAPDGSLRGCPRFFAAGSFFINSKAGNFEDFIVQDVWDFVTSHFSVRPERDAHALIGASMGGFASYNLNFKYGNNLTTAIEELRVLLGGSALAADMTTVLWENLTISSGPGVAQTGVVNFTVPSTGVYNIGFHCNSLSYTNGSPQPTPFGTLYLDEINVSVASACLTPTAVTVSNVQESTLDVSCLRPMRFCRSANGATRSDFQTRI